MTHHPLIAPSMLAADFARIGEEVERINQSAAADWIHLDIMDGVFVPNISFGFPMVEAISRLARKPLDVHLMTIHPEQYIERFAALGTRLVSVHLEACPHLHRVVQQIKGAGMQAGVALNPHTPAVMVEEILSELDVVLVMAVNPGFGGQKFIPSSVGKVRKLVRLREDIGAAALIEVDGGVNRHTGQLLMGAGADVLVAGSSVFAAPSFDGELIALKSLCRA